MSSGTRRERERQAEAWAMLSGLIEAAQVIPPVQRRAAGFLPLTVIGGFLGAGKTTLLNRLLVEPHGRRIAVLVNDFGRIEVDAALVRSWGEDTLSLTNGCACCSLAGDLTRTLVELVGRTEPPDAIVLEASGLADPHGIVQVALAHPALRLEGVVTLVDVETLDAHARDPDCAEVFLAQLGAADLLLLNKLDLVGAEVAETAVATLGRLAPGRPVLAVEQAAVPVDVVLGLRGSGRPAWPAADAGHAAGFESWGLDSDAPIDRVRFETLVAGLPPGVLRAKGLLWFTDAPGRRTLLQKVGLRWSLRPAEGGSEGPPRPGLVVIARRGSVDADALQRAWEACRA